LHTLEWRRTLAESTEERRVMWYPSLRNYEYGTVAEVSDSIRFIDERLLDEGRRCRVMLWTGEANPFEDAVQAAVARDCWNLNGGVFRWDSWHDSAGFVSPWSRRVGKTLQVYAGAANENDFDGFFTTMPGAFAHIDETIARTGAPRILKPADLYMHFYSAERPARLRSVHKLIRRWAIEAPTAPVFASTYCAAVHAASETARIGRLDDGTGWRFEAFGGCRTVRIDDEARAIDWARSTGILGAKREGRSLYVHLAKPDADLRFAERTIARPHVVEANCLLDDAVLEPGAVTVTATAHNPRLVIVGGFAPRMPVALTLDDTRSRARADEEGRVEIRLPEPGTTRVTVRVAQ
jgi:hypothetical protein